jgi:membrane fusion protein (multidrug efflux system)
MEFAVRRKWNLSQRAAALGAALMAAALAGCDQPQQTFTPPPVAVSTLELHPTVLPIELEYAAQLRGVREVEVRARVSGILLERRYDEGAAVKAGDLLFKIDPAPFRAEAERARAELGVRQADLRQAERERERILPLQERGVASARDRDNAIAAFETARASVAAAEAALRTAELSLSYTDVRAPIDGLTSREVRSEGSLVTAGGDSSLLTYIVQADRLYVEFAIPDADAELLRAAIAANPANVAVRILDARDTPAGGLARIEFVAPRVDDRTGTVAIRALLDNAGSARLPGKVARARVEGVVVADALVIPRRAVSRGMQGAYVWRIDAANNVTMQAVELGVSSGNDTTVVGGLSSGDRIVVDGILKLQPGAAVTGTPIETANGGSPPAGA